MARIKSYRLSHPSLKRKTARENSRTRPHSLRWLCSQHGCRGSVVVTYPTSNHGDVGSNPIHGNMFFFQNLFYIYMNIKDGVSVVIHISVYTCTVKSRI